MRTCLYLRTLTSLSVIFVSGTFFLTILTNTACAQEKAIRFEKRLLAIDANEGIDVADLNSDGKLDVVAGRNWYAATDFTPRPLRLIEDWNGYVQSNGDFCFDVNRDGHIDIIAGSYLPSEVYWYENPGPQQLELGAVWKQHLLMDTEQSSNEASALRDLDNDGVPEWITNSWDARNPLVAWKLEYAKANDEADQECDDAAADEKICDWSQRQQPRNGIWRYQQRWSRGYPDWNRMVRTTRRRHLEQTLEVPRRLGVYSFEYPNVCSRPQR